MSRREASPGRKRPHTLQSTFPHYTLERALQIPRAIVEHFSGRGGPPDAVADALGLKPSTGSWRLLIGSAGAYGLLEGGYATSELLMTSRASSIIVPTVENADRRALQEALLEPLVMRQFIEKYHGQRFPLRQFGVNALIGLGLPRERCRDALSIIEANLHFAGALLQTDDGAVVALDAAVARSRFAGSSRPAAPLLARDETAAHAENVYVSVGDDAGLLETLRRTLGYGKFRTVVPTHGDVVSDPEVVPLMLETMRTCRGAIVKLRRAAAPAANESQPANVAGEVLTEIGAALAFYGSNLIVLAERDIEIPPFLAGCFICTYERDRFDGAAVMRLLEGLSTFESR